MFRNIWSVKGYGWALLFIHVAYVKAGDGRLCHKCLHYTLSSPDQGIINTILQDQLNIDQSCFSSDDEIKDSDSTIIECPTPANGMRMTCATASGNITTIVSLAGYGTVDILTEFVYRNCKQVDDDKEQKCWDIVADLPPEVDALYKEVIVEVQKLQFVPVKGNVTGQYCYNDAQIKNTPRNRVECPTCSWHRHVNSSNEVLAPALKILSLTSTENCKNNINKETIAKQFCAKPRDGEVVQCGLVKGNLSFNFFQIGFEWEIVERGCLTLKKTDTISELQCETEPFSAEKKIFSEISVSHLKTSEVKFDGQICDVEPYAGRGHGKTSGTSPFQSGKVMSSLALLFCTLFI